MDPKKINPRKIVKDHSILLSYLGPNVETFAQDHPICQWQREAWDYSLVLCPLSQKRITPTKRLCPDPFGSGYLDMFLVSHTEPEYYGQSLWQAPSPELD